MRGYRASNGILVHSRHWAALLACTLLGPAPAAMAGENTALATEFVEPTTAAALTATAERSYSPPANRDIPVNLYWGDTHVHTNLSNDAFSMGNQDLSPDHAYGFARGEAVTTHTGMKARLRRPLDFLVVADHAVNLGLMARLHKEDPSLLETEQGKAWMQKFRETHEKTHDVLNGTLETFTERMAEVFNGDDRGVRLWHHFVRPRLDDPTFRKSVWDEVIANAERHNSPGKFTAFIGYEWTSNVRGAQHRNVIFRDGANLASQVLPFSRFDSPDPARLWDYLDSYARKTGGDAIAIPHNGNISGGVTFALVDFQWQPLTSSYAETRARWEVLNEVTQIKGDGEAYPYLSPDDEFADYETWHSWGGSSMAKIKINDAWLERKRADYARPALKRGLSLEASLGTNPFKFGMIGSSDAHTSLAATEEDSFWGKHSMYEPTAYRTSFKNDHAASGYAAVWARENTRDALFAAMRRKETYATTGPRMRVRFFGGWNFDAPDAMSPDLAGIGYAKGVPMGGDLTRSPAGKSPTFLIRATKDPLGANLDRVQVVKGWLAPDNSTHEKVYDLALSDGRAIPEDGSRAAPVGSTVDVDNVTYANTIGDPELSVVWTDPHFDPNERAFYYVRVIEIPTPRWTAYDRKFFKLQELMPEKTPLVTQERAYTSPIWYTP